MKKLIIILILLVWLTLFREIRDKQAVVTIESNDSITNLEQNKFAGKVFEAGLGKYFNANEKCAFYFECDCCSDILIFVDEKSYYLLSYCISNIDLTRGTFSVIDSFVKIASDRMLISKKYNWELEVNPNANPKYFINDTIHKKYAFYFKIKSCNGNLLESKMKNGEVYLAKETLNKKEDELKKLKEYGFDKYINLN